MAERARPGSVNVGVAVAVVIISMSVTSRASAVLTTYTNESDYMAALGAQGYVPVQEGFEDDAAWGHVRTTISGGPRTAPSVTNLGITWTSSSPNNNVTTSQGAARSGQWGFYSSPHGDYANGITDGWRGTGTDPLVAIGGWVRTNTPFAALVMFLDGDEQNAIDFGGDNILGTGGHRFFGVIETDGFSVFDYRETEGKTGDQKFIFGDDFTFAFGGVIRDCNENGIVDAFDITSGTSTDCNNNVIPDECEIDETSQAPGGPFYCTEDCEADCDENGIIDACQVVMPQQYSSGVLSPIGFGAPQRFTIPSAPLTRGNVIMHFTAYANLGGGSDQISVSLNGVPLGNVFRSDGSDCPETGPDEARLVVPTAVFNDAVNGGDAVIDMVASAEVDPEECDEPTYITVDVELFVPSPADANENGILDVCECPADVNGDGVVSFGDLLQVLGAWGPCSGCPEDLDGDGVVSFVDLLAVLGAWGECV